VEAEAENVKSKNSTTPLKRRLQLISSSSHSIGKKRVSINSDFVTIKGHGTKIQKYMPFI